MAQNRLAILQATRDLTARGDLKMPRLMPLQNWPVFQAVWSTVTLIQKPVTGGSPDRRCHAGNPHS